MNPWIAIVGARESGRHTLTRALSRALSARALSVRGFLQVPVVDEHGATEGYDLLDIAGGDRLPLARPSASPRICGWGFAEDAFRAARTWCAMPSDVVVLEVGRIEAAEDGHWPAVLAALRGPPRLVVVGIRPAVLAAIALRLPDPSDAIELPTEELAQQAFVDRVAELAARRAA